MSWESDRNHLRAGFSAKHLGIVNVSGFFRRLRATVDLDDPDPLRWSVKAEIDATSLDSGSDVRDGKLRGPEYLDVERYPTIGFRSTRVERSGEDYQVIGDLTMHGVTREVALRAQFNGEVTDARGRRCRGFSAKTVVRRSEFNVHPSTASGAEGDADGDEIRISLEAKAILRDESGADAPWRQRAEG